jgi:hypothetical protein
MIDLAEAEGVEFFLSKWMFLVRSNSSLEKMKGVED